MKLLLALLLLAGPAFASSVSITPAKPAPDTIQIQAYDYTAWAVGSLIYRGVEYLDCSDHGRCLQSAVSFDSQGEAFNPTQAGGYWDGLIPHSTSSKVLDLAADGTSLSSTVQMAYWMPVNGYRTSGHVLKQRIDLSRNTLRYTISFTIPANEYHSMGQYEILTGYMPPSFSHFRTLDPATGQLAELSDGPGEQALPVIFCTPDDLHCMGVVSEEPLSMGGYGRWRFAYWQCITKRGATGCVKWNAVTRIVNPSGTKTFHINVAVGTLKEVVRAIMKEQ